MKTFLERLEPAAALSRAERGLIGLLVLLTVAFCVVTVGRQAFLSTRKGDQGVFFRTAWAVRAGTSLYTITDEHGWHYLYPPFLASVLLPLADPPAEVLSGPSPPIVVPYRVSCAIWYWLNIACLAMALHLVAAALERHWGAGVGPPWPRYARGWWALRLWPFLAVIFYVGSSLQSGQVTTLLMLCLSGCAASLIDARSGRAGLWLGTAIGLKLFPAYLLLYPLLRRDLRFLLGAGAATLLTILIPFAIMGPSPAVTAYRELVVGVLLGEATNNINPAVIQELHGSDGPIQSFQYILYHLSHWPAPAPALMPPHLFFVLHGAISATVTAAALFAMRKRADGLGEFLFFASLACLCLPILPVSRPHYFAIAAIAVAGVLASQWSVRRGLWPGWAATSIIGLLLLAEIPTIAGVQSFVDLGATTLATLALIAYAISLGRKRVTAGAQPMP